MKEKVIALMFVFLWQDLIFGQAVPGAPQLSKSKETATMLEIQLFSLGVAGPQVTEYKAKITRLGSMDEPRIVTVQAEYPDYVDDRPTPRTTMIIDNLEPSTQYSIIFYAINAVGEGTPTEIKHTTREYNVPSNVIVLNEINSKYPRAIMARWLEPEDGGLAILYYLVEYREISVKNTTSLQDDYDLLSPVENQDWTSVRVKPDNNQFTIQNLLPGRFYQVQVLAVNSKGLSLPEPKVIKTKDDVPSNVIVLNEINSKYPRAIMVRWLEPEDGGLAILYYMVEYREVSVKNTTSRQDGYDLLSPIENQDWTSVRVKPDNNQFTIQNLLPGRFYQVQVLAVNSKGQSLPEPKVIKTKDDPNYRPVGGASRQAVASTIFTLVAAISIACFRSFL